MAEIGKVVSCSSMNKRDNFRSCSVKCGAVSVMNLTWNWSDDHRLFRSLCVVSHFFLSFFPFMVVGSDRSHSLFISSALSCFTVPVRRTEPALLTQWKSEFRLWLSHHRTWFTGLRLPDKKQSPSVKKKKGKSEIQPQKVKGKRQSRRLRIVEASRHKDQPFYVKIFLPIELHASNAKYSSHGRRRGCRESWEGVVGHCVWGFEVVSSASRLSANGIQWFETGCTATWNLLVGSPNPNNLVVFRDMAGFDWHGRAAPTGPWRWTCKIFIRICRSFGLISSRTFISFCIGSTDHEFYTRK